MVLGNALVKEVFKGTNPAVRLYRHISKQLPRVLILYDINMEPSVARNSLRQLFRKNGHVTDGRAIDLLINKANMEVEETLMQWKQKSHLLTLLQSGIEDPRVKTMSKQDIQLEKFFANMDKDNHEEDDDDDYVL